MSDMFLTHKVSSISKLDGFSHSLNMTIENLEVALLRLGGRGDEGRFVVV